MSFKAATTHESCNHMLKMNGYNISFFKSSLFISVHYFSGSTMYAILQLGNSDFENVLIYITFPLVSKLCKAGIGLPSI